MPTEIVECDYSRKDVKIEVITQRHNVLVCRSIEQNNKIVELERKLGMKRETSEDEVFGGIVKSSSSRKKRKDSAPGRIQVDTWKKSEMKESGNTIESLDLLPRKRVIRTADNLKKMTHYNPVKPEDIYLRLSEIEKDIKKTEPDLYFKIKEFTLSDEDSVSYMDLNLFAEEISHFLYKKRRTSTSYSNLNEIDFQQLIEELCFEIMYPKLFVDPSEDYDAENYQLQEKLFILQNVITPKMIGIKEENFATNVYQLASSGTIWMTIELKKINSVKSPLNKCSVIIQSVNCISCTRV